MAGTPGTPRLLRAINDRAALDLLLEQGPLSRTRLGALTGLSKPTASQLLARLEAAGLVVPTGTTAGHPGPSAQLYEVNPAAAHVAGLDVTPTRMLAAVADITGRTVGTYELPTPGRRAQGTVERVLKAVDGAAERAGIVRSALHRVAIGTPGAFDPTTGRLRYARHLPGWHSPHLLDELGDALGLPLDVDNDVNLAAVAEQRVGQARDCGNFVLLWGEEGIGAAVVIGGRLHRGATGGAGEVAFLPLPGTPVVRNVSRINEGGFQALAGALPVLQLAREHGLHASTAQDALARALRTPGAGDAVLGQFAYRLAVGLAAMVAVIDPELVVLAGGVITAGGERLRALVQAELADLTVPRPKLLLTAVTENPVLCGALQSALSTTRDQVFDTTLTTGSTSTTKDRTTE
jgi:predicted NBD/HSP70 family sugar kinase